METSKHLFNELEKAEQLFSDGSIKNGQKILREAIKTSKNLKKIPNKLRHKINSVISKSRYFDDMSSFATNPKRDSLITEISKLVANPNKNPREHAHSIHNFQRQWQLLDISGKPASRSQWLKFNELTNKAWESCKDYFEEIKQIKINNASNRKIIIQKINDFSQQSKNKWPPLIKLVKFLKQTYEEWQTYAPVLDTDIEKLKSDYFNARKPINDEIRRQESLNKEQKELLINRVENIQLEDNEQCINEFKKIKLEWSKIGPAGKKIEKTLWNKFNKSADRFFEEKNNLIREEINLLAAIKKDFKNNLKTVDEVKLEISSLENIKNTKEYKSILKDIRIANEAKRLEKKEAKVLAYKNIYDILLKKLDTDMAPNIFIDDIKKSYESKKSNIDNLKYACIKIEVLAGIESLKKDQELRNKIQLELLTNKFNKNNRTKNDDLHSLISYFINNFSNQDAKTEHKKLWSRIDASFDKLI